MFLRNFKKTLTYGIIGAMCSGTALSIHSNNYDLNSIGIIRLARATATVFGISLHYKINLYSHNIDTTSQKYIDIKSKCHKEAAEKLLKLCCANKGVYIKVGQHIAALEYLLPTEYVQTMKILHSHAPETNLTDIKKVIREEFGKEPSEIFTYIDPKPLGAASLAQVHRASLPDGKIVAVKVQHPYVKKNSFVDMRSMEILVKIVEFVFPDFKFQWLVDETKKNIPRELDFTQEGHNAERLSKTFGVKYNWLKVPNILWNLTTTRVITMEYVDGGQVNDLKYINQHGINPFEVSDKIGKLYSDMIFTEGFVHSDPHPGNILVRKMTNGSCEIIMLDHGLYAELSQNFRKIYAELWLSILNVDRKAMRAHCTQLGVKSELYGLFTCMLTGRSWDSVLAGINKISVNTAEKDVLRKELPNALPAISGILDSVDRQMLLVLKTNDLLKGIEYALGTSNRMASFRIMSDRCIRTVYVNQLRLTQSNFKRFFISIAQYYALFKLTLYYNVLFLFTLWQGFMLS